MCNILRAHLVMFQKKNTFFLKNHYFDKIQIRLEIVFEIKKYVKFSFYFIFFNFILIF